MNSQQREAYDRLRWHHPSPAERSRLKLALGWRRTREETTAHVAELAAAGMVKAAIIDEVGISDRYLRSITSTRGDSPDLCPANPHHHRAVSELTCETGPTAQPGRSSAPLDGFATFADLDAWLASSQKVAS